MTTTNTLFGKLFNQQQVQHYDSEGGIPNVQGFDESQEPLIWDLTRDEQTAVTALCFSVGTHNINYSEAHSTATIL